MHYERRRARDVQKEMPSVHPSRGVRKRSWFYIYILKCADASLYIGYSTDVAKRLAAHNSGKGGAKYTKARRPVELLYKQGFRTRSKAQKREYEMKQWTRAEKLAFLRARTLKS